MLLYKIELALVISKVTTMKSSLLLFTFFAVLAFIAIPSDATVIRYVHAIAGAPAVLARGFFQDVTVSYRDVSDYSYAVPDTRIKLTDNAGIPLGSFVIGNASEYTAVIRGSLSDMASIGVTLFVDSFQPLVCYHPFCFLLLIPIERRSQLHPSRSCGLWCSSS